MRAENKALKGQASCDETPKKTSENSSIPPSKDQKPNKKPSSSKKRKPRTEGNNGRCLDPNPTQTVVARAKTCPPLGGDGESTGFTCNIRQQRNSTSTTDTQPAVEQYGGHCPHCHET